MISILQISYIQVYFKSCSITYTGHLLISVEYYGLNFQNTKRQLTDIFREFFPEIKSWLVNKPPTLIRYVLALTFRLTFFYFYFLYIWVFVKLLSFTNTLDTPFATFYQPWLPAAFTLLLDRFFFSFIIILYR